MIKREQLIDRGAERLAERAAELAIEELRRLVQEPCQVPVGVSARHVHLSKQHLDMLFGTGYELTPYKPLSQPGQFAANEQVELVGSKGRRSRLRILGPVRRESQVELAYSECRGLGINPPVRRSGELAGTPGILIKGPAGEVSLDAGVIIAERHIHMTPADARWFGVADGEKVVVLAEGPRGGSLGGVTVRVTGASRLELHIDTDDSNAFRLRQGQWVTVRKEVRE